MLFILKKELIRMIAWIILTFMGVNITAYMPQANVPENPPIVQEQEENENNETTIPTEDDEYEYIVVTPTEKAPESTEPVDKETDTTIPSEDSTASTEPTEPPHVHNYQSNVVAPTCLEKGYTTYSCACGADYKSNSVEKLGHDYKSIVIVPTKESEGYTKHTCTRCGMVHCDNYVAKLPAVIFKNVNETVYANTTVNIRTGPGTEHQKIGSLTYGQSITRTGIGDNGWSRVVYNGQEGYMYTSYIQTSKPTPPFDGSTPSADVKAKMDANADLIGILYVPSVGMTPCPIYACHSGRDLQGLADAKNSAYGVGVYDSPAELARKIEIGDHNNHNFSVNKNIAVGTIGYINLGDRVLKMQCVSTILNGKISEYDANIMNDDGKIVTITCSGQDGHRTINRWVVTSDSDVSFGEYFDIVTKYFSGCR